MPSSSLTAGKMSSMATSRGRRYTAKTHGDVVVGGFKQLWHLNLLCDTRLRVQDETFHVHRCFLAASSQYFYSMFTEGFQESAQDEVELCGVTAKGLEALLDYAYTGSVVINSANLQEVLEAAAHLQYNEVQEFCAQYLKDEVNIENCLQFLKMAEMYELIDCQKKTMHFILQNFIPVAQNTDFQDVSVELLCAFLMDDALRAESELEVFAVAIKWLNLTPERKALAKQVLPLVRYGLIDAEQMDEVYTEPLMLSDGCQDILQSSLSYHMKLFKQPIMDLPMSKMRDYEPSLLILGAGYLDNTLSTHMMAARFKDGHLKDFELLCPKKERQYFACVAVVNDFVYVVGGQNAMAGDGSNATSNVFRYNPRDDKWLQVSSMTVPRTHFVLVALSTCLIAVGGKHNRVALSSAEKYDFMTNEWLPVASLPATVFSHAGCCNANKVYVSGGCSGDDFTDEMHCYDDSHDGWLLRSPMNQSRGYHVMISHNNKILACAGNTDAGDRRDVLNTESYDVELDQWTVLSPAPLGQSEAPAVKCANKVYILGGYSWDIHSFQDIIQGFDVEKEVWEETDVVLPEAMTGVVATYVRLPVRMYNEHKAF